jgi:hypothetical protein
MSVHDETMLIFPGGGLIGFAAADQLEAPFVAIVMSSTHERPVAATSDPWKGDRARSSRSQSYQASSPSDRVAES